MEFIALTRENTGCALPAEVSGKAGGAVHVDLVNVTGLDDTGLDARLQQIGEARNRLDGFLAEALAEKKRRTCSFDATEALRRGLRHSRKQAQRVMDDAQQLETLPNTREALVDSRITSEHARILGGAAKTGSLDEQKMLAAAETQSPEQFRRTVREHQNQLSSNENAAKRLERQRKARAATFSERDDGMWCLYALFDPVTAQGIRAVLNQKTDMEWHGTGNREHGHVRQRRADAIAQLLTRTDSDDTGGCEARPQPTSLVVVADYDTIDQKLNKPRLSDGSPLPDGKFRELACDAEILTGIFNNELQCLSLGRQRHTSPQLRAALIARDRGCIGCGTQPEWCVSHHIEHWADGGPTQPDNLVLLCHDCHHKAHHRDWVVEKHPDTGRYYLRPPWQQPPKPTPRL